MSAIDGLLTPAVAGELVDGVAGAFDAQRLAIGIQRFLRGLAAVVELAAETPGAGEADTLRPLRPPAGSKSFFAPGRQFRQPVVGNAQRARLGIDDQARLR